MNRELKGQGSAEGPEFRAQLGNRLREVEKHVGSRERAAKLPKWQSLRFSLGWRKAAARIEHWPKLSAETGYSLDWMAFGDGPKHTETMANSPQRDDRIVRDRAEAIYEAILRDISGFLDRRGWNMTLRRQHRLPPRSSWTTSSATARQTPAPPCSRCSSKPAFLLCFAGCVQTAYYTYGSITLLIIDGDKLQCYVCQCVCRSGDASR